MIFTVNVYDLRGIFLIKECSFTKLLAIGPKNKLENSKVTGPSMMFELLLADLKRRQCKVKVIDLSDNCSMNEARKVGGVSLTRIWFYLALAPIIFHTMYKNKVLVYLIIAPTLAAFIRDGLVIWISRMIGRTMVCHLFGGYGEFYSKQNRFIKKIIGITLSLAENIIVEGDLVKEELSFVKNYDRKVIVIPNGLPELNLNKAENPKALRLDGVINIFYMSNMIETKGYLDVLEAVRVLIKERGIDVKCHFAGKFMVTVDALKFKSVQKAMDNFLNLIKSYDLTEHVSYSESVFGKDKEDKFSKADFFVLPSNYVYEMQPVAVLEAMAYGCVVLSTNFRLIPNMLIDGETGLFVQYNDPESIADKIEYLHDNPEIFREFSSNAIQLYKNNFSAKMYTDRIFDVLSKVHM